MRGPTPRHAGRAVPWRAAEGGQGGMPPPVRRRATARLPSFSEARRASGRRAPTKSGEGTWAGRLPPIPAHTNPHRKPMLIKTVEAAGPGEKEGSRGAEERSVQRNEQGSYSRFSSTNFLRAPTPAELATGGLAPPETIQVPPCCRRGLDVRSRQCPGSHY